MAAAVILCAGKGTRMNDDSINKVCFPAAGVPVIKRIVDNLRIGGVDTFVIVVGHRAESVMEALAYEKNIIYAYQKEQKGTGHAALCGLEALRNVGYKGRAIVTMGDKIVSSTVIKGLLEYSNDYKAVWGVQPVAANYNGGRIVMDNNKIYGVVEFADAALMAISTLPEGQRRQKLKELRLNDKKAEKVLKKASESHQASTVIINGKVFNADQVLSSPYSNAGLYCFDIDSAVDNILKCDSQNAQGEIYLTDALAHFSKENQAILYEVKDKKDMLTFSTKTELREISGYFYKTATELKETLLKGNGDGEISEKTDREVALIDKFIETFGNKKVIISKAPGRVNFMGRHIDHRGGSINVMAIDRDISLVVSPRNDDKVNIVCVNDVYDALTFSVSENMALSSAKDWLSYIESDKVKETVKNTVGNSGNYAKGAILRIQFTTNVPLCGMDIVLDGSVPIAAGLSSSSAIVVATAEAVAFLNNLNFTDDEFVELCGEAEWFVGSRGGPGDHAAMKCCKKGEITHISFKPLKIGESAPFFEDCGLIVANSMQMSRKSEGSRDKFNAKVVAYEVALMLLKKQFPQYGFKEFRDIAALESTEAIYEMVKFLPRLLTREQILEKLPENKGTLERLFTTHADPGVYNIRGVALFGIGECMRAEKCLDALKTGAYDLIGEMMKISHRGDSVTDPMPVDDYTISQLMDNETPLYLVPGAYGCSTEKIDELCNILNSCEGVFGSELVGAGLGGCVIALVRKENVQNTLDYIYQNYYDKYGYEHKAEAYLPSEGANVIC